MTYYQECRQCWWYRQTSFAPIHQNHPQSGSLLQEPELQLVSSCHPQVSDDDLNWIVFRHDGIRARVRIGEGKGVERRGIA